MRKTVNAVNEGSMSEYASTIDSCVKDVVDMYIKGLGEKKKVDANKISDKLGDKIFNMIIDEIEK